MIRNQAGQVVPAQMISATTGADFSGTVTVYVNKDNGGQVLGTGSCTLQGHGSYNYLPSQTETDGAEIAYVFIGTGAISVTVTVPTITLQQLQALQIATGPGVLTALDLVRDALTEIGAISSVSDVPSEDGQFVLRKLNRILDNWNAERPMTYASAFLPFTLTPSLSPHTIGPNSATWTVVQRPVMIEAAMLTIGVGINEPIAVRSQAWYFDIATPGITSSIPTDLFYQPLWPNGDLFFYPVPTSALGVILQVPLVLAKLALADAFSLPPGYQDALTLTLAEEIAPGMGKQLNPQTTVSARKARARIFGLGQHPPALQTKDAGMPGSTSPAERGNYRSGWWSR